MLWFQFKFKLKPRHKIMERNELQKQSLLTVGDVMPPMSRSYDSVGVGKQ
jgi:hypothetical protein